MFFIYLYLIGCWHVLCCACTVTLNLIECVPQDHKPGDPGVHAVLGGGLPVAGAQPPAGAEECHPVPPGRHQQHLLLGLVGAPLLWHGLRWLIEWVSEGLYRTCIYLSKISLCIQEYIKTGFTMWLFYIGYVLNDQKTCYIVIIHHYCDIE